MQPLCREILAAVKDEQVLPGKNYEIRDGEIVGLNLSPLEQSWLQLCWQAAT